MLQASTAHAQPPAIPKRFVLFWNPQGACSGLPLPNGKDAFWPEGPSGSDFVSSRILSPLDRHREQMLLLRGFHAPVLRQEVMDECGVEQGDGLHGVGCRTLLTGACAYYDPADPTRQMAGGPSVDQIIAQHVGDDSFRRSVCLIAGGNKGGHRGVVNYVAANEPIRPIRSPLEGYLFAIGASVGADADRSLRLREARASALDVISDDIRRTRVRLPAAGRHALDVHLESIRALEREHDSRFLSCDPGGDTFPNEASTWDAHSLHFQTIAAAIGCDQSRVFSLMSASGGGDTAGDVSFMDPEWPTNYHSTGHASGGNGDGGGTDPATRARALEVMVRISEFYAEQLADFIDRLKGTPELDGSSAFDHTVIFWTNEMAHGNHGNDNMPHAIFGGGWHFNQGHYFNEESGSIYRPNFWFGNLLTALAQSMGVPTERVGSPIFFDEDHDKYASLWRTSA